MLVVGELSVFELDASCAPHTSLGREIVTMGQACSADASPSSMEALPDPVQMRAEAAKHAKAEVEAHTLTLETKIEELEMKLAVHDAPREASRRRRVERQVA